MEEMKSHKRMAENEVLFRARNERVQEGFEEIKRIAKEDNQAFNHEPDDSPLHFFCECADENCTDRIEMKPSIYDRIHKKRDQFIIICGHNVASIEKVIHEEPSYCVVKKFRKPPEKATGIHATPIKNT